jgi:hypothetical protein
MRERGDPKTCDVDCKYLKLKCHIEPMLPSSPIFNTIRKYVDNTHAATHDKFTIELVSVFSLNRPE